MTLDCWEQLDRLPPWSKLELLCEELGVRFEAGTAARPLQTVAKLLTFRNTIAHGRSSELKSKPVVRTVENYQAAHHEDILADWERLIQTSEFAVRAREDVRAVLEAIHKARRDEATEPLFSTGVGLYGATLEKP